MAEETNFKKRVQKFLEEKGIWNVKYFANAYTKAGIPDVLCCLPNGKFMAIELKSEKGKPSDLQEINLKDICKLGGFGILLYPSGFEEFKKSIEFYLIHNGNFKPNYNGYLILKRGWYE